jgi:riboflavin synthase alpha subunit
MTTKTLEKLNENLKIAIANKNKIAIDRITLMIDKYKEATYIPDILIIEQCLHRGKLIYEKSCKCASGRIWECELLGQVNESLCGKSKCKKYKTKEGM